MKRGTAWALTAVAVAATVASAAGGATLCEKKKGQILVRDACRKRERPVDTSALGAAGPRGRAGDPGPVGDPAQFPLRLVDSNDVEVGKVIQFFPEAALVEGSAASVPTPLTLFVSPTGFPSDSHQLSYESTDCSGLAYMDEGFTPEGFAPAAVVWGLAAYYATGSRRDLTYGSLEYGLDPNHCPVGTTATARGTCCGTSSGTGINQVPTARVPLSAFGLVPPFRAVVR